MSMMNTEVPVPERLSFSSLSTYVECGERWRLERLYGVRKSTWFATVGGSAVHALTETYDLGLHYGTEDPLPTFKEVFDLLLDDERAAGIEIKPSGKKLVNLGPNGGPNKKDYDWWLHFGPLMIQAWINWRATSDWEILVLDDGTPAIELAITKDVGGDTFRGLIDRVMVNVVTGQIAVVDIKTGADSGLLQLGTYRVGLKREYGINVDLGAFWSPLKNDGELGWLFDLTVYSDAYVDHQFEMAWRGIRNGVFLANPSSFCNACDAKPVCRAGGGQDIHVYPIETRMTARVSGSSPERV